MCKQFAYFQEVVTEDNVRKGIVFYTEKKWILVKTDFHRASNYSIGVKEYDINPYPTNVESSVSS